MSSTEHTAEMLSASKDRRTRLPIATFDLKSSLLRACYYQPSTRLLAIRTRSGRWLIHQDVDRESADALANSAAPGFFYARHLRHHLGKTISRHTIRAMLLLIRIRRLENARHKRQAASTE